MIGALPDFTWLSFSGKPDASPAKVAILADEARSLADEIRRFSEAAAIDPEMVKEVAEMAKLAAAARHDYHGMMVDGEEEEDEDVIDDDEILEEEDDELEEEDGEVLFQVKPNLYASPWYEPDVTLCIQQEN